MRPAPVDDAEVHAWRAILYAMRRHIHKKEGDPVATRRGREEIAEAQRQDPEHVRALAATTLYGDAVPVERARAATAAHGDDWLSWYLLAEAAGDDRDARWSAAKEALRRAQANPSIRLMETLQGKHRPRWGHEDDEPKTAAPPSSAR